MSIRNVVVSSMVLLMAGLAASFQGEARGAGRRAPPPKLSDVSIDGTIVKIAGGVIYASDDKSQPWAIELQPSTKVLVTGTATADFLRKGLLVQIDARPDEKGMIKDKVSKLTIVTPTTEGQAILPDMGSKPKGKPGKAAPPPPSGDFKGSIGMIVGVHVQKLTIKIEKKLSEIELAEDPKIDVSVDMLNWATRGDKIQAKGLLNPRNPGVCLAKDVSISLAQPLSSGRKKTTVAKTEAGSTDKAASKKSDAADKSAGGDEATPKKKKDSKKKPAASDDNK